MKFLPDIELNQEEKDLVAKRAKELNVQIEPKSITEKIKKLFVVSISRVELAPWLPKSLAKRIIMLASIVSLIYGILFSNPICFLTGSLVILWISPKMRQMTP